MVLVENIDGIKVYLAPALGQTRSKQGLVHIRTNPHSLEPGNSIWKVLIGSKMQSKFTEHPIKAFTINLWAQVLIRMNPHKLRLVISTNRSHLVMCDTHSSLTLMFMTSGDV